ncbi:hypothetical protein Q9W35_001747 [Salmonella enterica]|nr:hypothetical protein [Salmonella enterica]
MIRIIEIYSRLEAIDGFLALMLKQPDSYRERMISERITELVEYIDHVNAVMWTQQERGKLCDFDTRYILPAISEIWLQVKQVKQELTRDSRPLCELAGSITGLISLVSFYLSRIEGSGDKNRVLH